MSWDPKLYLSFGAERTRPAAELLARLPVDAPARVADLGCGPGNSIALLAARWPGAALDGIDSSEAMLAEARASGVKARWIAADIAQWKPDAAYDVLFSNAALQWVPGHETLLPRLMSFVKEGGAFAFQVPCNFDAPSHAILSALAGEAPWAAKLAHLSRVAPVHAPETYYGMLEPYARGIDIWETAYLQILEGEDAVYRWVSGTALRPFVAALAEGERAAFLAEYRTRLARAYPMRASGRTLFPFKRLFAVARR